MSFRSSLQYHPFWVTLHVDPDKDIDIDIIIDIDIGIYI